MLRDASAQLLKRGRGIRPHRYAAEELLQGTVPQREGEPDHNLGAVGVEVHHEGGQGSVLAAVLVVGDVEGEGDCRNRVACLLRFTRGEESMGGEELLVAVGGEVLDA